MRSSHTPTQILLSFSTAPLLLLLIGSKVLASFMKDMGQTTEEVFRGDRLPILKISHHDDQS
ncbi:MAG: hypothetical protein Kow00121_39680 [Elainellaceae cyanobacterium]